MHKSYMYAIGAPVPADKSAQKIIKYSCCFGTKGKTIAIINILPRQSEDTFQQYRQTSLSVILFTFISSNHPTNKVMPWQKYLLFACNCGMDIIEISFGFACLFII